MAHKKADLRDKQLEKFTDTLSMYNSSAIVSGGTVLSLVFTLVIS